MAPAFASPTRQLLLRLRSLIFDAARQAAGVGELSETLKWGQPSYAPVKPRIGSSVRLGMVGDDKVAVYFICHTHLVDRFREIYPDVFEFDGNRALRLTAGQKLPVDELKHCIAMALTYHLTQR